MCYGHFDYVNYEPSKLQFITYILEQIILFFLEAIFLRN